MFHILMACIAKLSDEISHSFFALTKLLKTDKSKTANKSNAKLAI